MQTEREKWNAKYQESQEGWLEPDPYLIEVYNKFVAPRFPAKGRALDLAGGMGRHAIWLARQGWQTTLIDISRVALDTARKRSSGEKLALEFIETDLDSYTLPRSAFDLVLVFNFLQRSMFNSLRESVRPGGVLIYKTRMQPRNDDEGPEIDGYLLGPDELPRIFSGFQVLDYRVETGSRGPLAALVAQKSVNFR